MAMNTAAHPRMRILVALWLCLCVAVAHASEVLPSWRPGATRDAIVAFVESTTTPGSPRFVPIEQRIATFDNDGTLWAEQPYRSAIAGDIHGVMAAGEKAIMQIIADTHAGMTTEEFSDVVRQWIRSARHPVSQRRYDEMIYQPMRELLEYLRAHGYQTWIVSGGGQEFMRPWVEQAYGIPPWQVIGSYGELEYRVVDGKPALRKIAKVGLIDDHGGKPVGIQRFIGQRPVLAFGNSDGDLSMLQWTVAGSGPRFAGLVHHTDARREYAYDRASKIGTLDRALDAAEANGWTVVDMARDWSVVFPEPASIDALRTSTTPPEASP